MFLRILGQVGIFGFLEFLDRCGFVDILAILDRSGPLGFFKSIFGLFYAFMAGPILCIFSYF